MGLQVKQMIPKDFFISSNNYSSSMPEADQCSSRDDRKSSSNTGDFSTGNSLSPPQHMMDIPGRTPQNGSVPSAEPSPANLSFDSDDYPFHQGPSPLPGDNEEDSDELRLRNIASFMTLSDAASLSVRSEYHHVWNSDLTTTTAAAVAVPVLEDEYINTPAADSWAVGVELVQDDIHFPPQPIQLLHVPQQQPNFSPEAASLTKNASLWSIATPATPGMVALSPGGIDYDEEDGVNTTIDSSMLTPCQAQQHHHQQLYVQENIERILQKRRLQWAREKLTTAIFAHPGSLRSFCQEAYQKAQEIRLQQTKEYEEQHQQREDSDESAENVICCTAEVAPLMLRPVVVVQFPVRWASQLLDYALHKNIPLFVLMDLVESVTDISIETAGASFLLSGRVIQEVVYRVGQGCVVVWEGVTNFSPLGLLEAIINLQFNAMGKTSEALASGIQSVATGVGSASSMALHRLSAANMSSNNSFASLGGASMWNTGNGNGNNHGSTGVLNQKLLAKLSAINDAARVVEYKELEDPTGGLTKHAISRTRRMMHYTVSLKPFVATVAVGDDHDLDARDEMYDEFSDSIDEENGMGSPFMCTPQSFPPTPQSRQLVLLQKSRFSEDDIFAARDRLRVHGALDSSDERTREMAAALAEAQLLAVFDGANCPNDIRLSCGQHIATKIGNLNYSNCKGMIPLLRNCNVYFELTVLPHVGPVPPISMPTLSLGISTQEMPPNTLVGAWQGSAGICTTGQVLLAGQWCAPWPDPSHSCYTTGATVGCLVCLDDDSAFETWDGVMITARLTFSVNGQVVLLQPNGGATVPTPYASAEAASSDGQQQAAPLQPTPHVTLLIPAAEDVFPTVTLQSASTSVMCRFSSEDILAKSRAMMGAVSGSAVYAVDGSILELSD